MWSVLVVFLPVAIIAGGLAYVMGETLGEWRDDQEDRLADLLSGYGMKRDPRNSFGKELRRVERAQDQWMRAYRERQMKVRN